MLGYMEPDAHCCRISTADVKVHVAHRGIERSWIRIDHFVAWRNSSFHDRSRAIRLVLFKAAAAGPSTGEEKHVANTLLVAGRIIGEHEGRTACTVADHTHARPDINRAGDAIASFRDKDNAFSILGFDSVDCRLNSSAVVGRAVCFYREMLFRKINGLGIVEPKWIVRRCLEGQH